MVILIDERSPRIALLVLAELKENYLESVMISLPNYGAQLTLTEFLPLWRVVEDYIEKQKILSAGVCDFMLPLLSELCDAVKVRPSTIELDQSSEFSTFRLA